MKRNLNVRVLSDVASIARILPEWNDLWLRCLHATTFQRPEWLFSWIEIFQPSRPVFLEVRNGARLVGIAPLLIYQRDSERVLALMGGGVSDYLDVLIDPEFSIQALLQVREFLVCNVSGWDVLELTDLSGESPLVKANPHAAESHDACPVLNIPSALDDLTRVVPSHKLRNLRNARRRSEKAGGGEIDVADAASVDSLLDAMIHLHEKRWAQTDRAGPGVLADAAVQRFHRLVAPLLLGRGVLRLYGLRFEGRYIATLYALFEQNVAYHYLQGYDPECHDLSPGTQIVGCGIEDALRSGIPKINFLRGREAYKYSWGARDEETFCVRLERSALQLSAPQSRVAA